MIRNLPAWIEASGVIVTAMVVSISVSSVALYRLGALEDQVKDLVTAIEVVQILKHDIDRLQKREEETMRLFEKFSNNVGSLAISVAKIEAKLEER